MVVATNQYLHYTFIKSSHEYPTMDYDQLCEYFETQIMPSVIERYGADDTIALIEAWFQLTDSLFKNGVIDQQLADTCMPDKFEG